MAIITAIAEDNTRQTWEDYLVRKKIEHHAYSWAWRQIVPEVFRQQTYYLYATDTAAANEIVGILPLVHFKSILFGHSLISLPYLNAGGILADSDEIARSLLNQAIVLGKELNTNYLELRQRQQHQFLQSESLPLRSHKVSMKLELPPQAEDLFSAFPPKLRSQIRRPTKSGIIAQVESGSFPNSASLSSFYEVFSEHMRDLGTPVYSKQLFFSVKKHFGERCRIITVWHQDKPIAAGITLAQGRGVEIPWASALKKYHKYSPNMLLYWEAIKTACVDGYQSFDFGRSSPDSGTYRFKAQWGASPVPLFWYYHIFKGEIPDVNPQNPKYSLLVNAWKRLPLGIANKIGALLTRSIP